jgi:hypothetical protein
MLKVEEIDNNNELGREYRVALSKSIYSSIYYETHRDKTFVEVLL